MLMLPLGRSKTRDAILTFFFSVPEKEYYLRELERLLKVSVANIRRELLKLEAAGIFRSRRVGNLRYFSLNTAHPLFPEYRKIVSKTIGIAGTLTAVFTDIRRVELAFIFGSVAEGVDRSGSDIDLFVIGSISSRKLHELLAGVHSEIGREINAVLFDVEEVRRRLAERDHFVTSVMEGKKEYVKGSEDELRRAVAPR